MAKNQGFRAMDEEKHKEVSSRGGEESGGQFEEGSQRASEAGKEGAEAQPTEAKRKGGKHSSRS